jgi:hypothetical protein
VVSTIYSKEAWAYSPNGRIKYSLSLSPPKNRQVTAVATLSRVWGSGSAKAFIRQRCDQNSSSSVLCGIRDTADDARSIESGSTITKVTFEVEADRALGHASFLLFIS